jgi:hypothetical protein
MRNHQHAALTFIAYAAYELVKRSLTGNVDTLHGLV